MLVEVSGGPTPATAVRKEVAAALTQYLHTWIMGVLKIAKTLQKFKKKKRTCRIRLFMYAMFIYGSSTKDLNNAILNGTLKTLPTEVSRKYVRTTMEEALGRKTKVTKATVTFMVKMIDTMAWFVLEQALEKNPDLRQWSRETIDQAIAEDVELKRVLTLAAT
jgi:hypothetical protein